MERRQFCVRPMCGGAPAAALHYDYAASTVWLDPMTEELVPGAWVICVAHAERLGVPAGWTLVDRRVPASLSPLPTVERTRSEVGYRPPLAV